MLSLTLGAPGLRSDTNRRSYLLRALALGAPALLMALMAAIDIGLGLSQMSTLDNAAKAGVQYAARFPSHVQGIVDTVKWSLSTSRSEVAVRSMVHCECPGAGKVVACAGSAKRCGGEPADAFRTVTVTVSMPYSSPLPTSGLIKTTALSRAATFRVR